MHKIEYLKIRKYEPKNSHAVLKHLEKVENKYKFEYKKLTNGCEEYSLSSCKRWKI